MATIHLTPNAIPTICNCSREGKTSDLKPVIQITDLRLVDNQKPNNTTERFRIMISDGVFLQHGMLGTQLNHLVNSGQLQKGSVVQITEYTCGKVQDRMVIIILALNLMLEKGDLLGDPILFSPSTNAQAPPLASNSASLQPSLNQSGTASYNPQPFGGSSFSGSALRPTINEGTQMRPPEMDYKLGSNFYGDSSRNNPVRAPSTYSKMEYSADFSGPHGVTNMRPFQQPYHQQSPMYNRGPVSRNDGPSRISPIASLNPYQGSWTIKARVTAKAEIRHYKNSKGEGKVFSFDLLDSSGGEIRVTCFNAVADQYYELIEAGNVYLISKGTLKPAQKAFNHLRNDFEITLDNSSTVQPCFADDGSIQKQQFHFRLIRDIEGMDSKSVVDVIGIVSSISSISSLMTKRGTETQKRILHLKDMSGRSVEITLWGSFCHAEGQRLQTLCDSGVHPVLALKSCIVNEFNGKTLGTMGTTQLFIQPDFPEAQMLKGWFENEGKCTQFIPISQNMMTFARTDVRKTVSQIKDERLGTSEKPDYISLSATIIYIKPENFCYTACPNVMSDRKCSKKVVNNGDGTWRCDKCDQTMGECDYRYILQFQIQDHTGSTWVTAFQECGEEIVGVPAKDLYDLKYESGDDEKFAEILRNALYNKFLFKLRVKEETYGDEQRVKSTVQKAEKVSFSSETRFLLDLMDKLKNGDSSFLAPKQECSISNSGRSNAGSVYFPQPSPSAGNYNRSTVTGSQQFEVRTNQASQYGKYYGSVTTGSNGVSITCSSCGVSGHSSVNCPSVMTSQGNSYEGNFNSRMTTGVGGGGVSSSGECYKCHQVGHWAKDCPGLGNVAQASSGGGGGGGVNLSSECYKCHQVGHWARDCPSLANVSQAASGGGGGVNMSECYKCHQLGHYARDCPGLSNVPQAASGYGGGANLSSECYKCHQAGHWARDCPGLGSVPQAYGNGNGATGRYAGGPKQYIGGF